MSIWKPPRPTLTASTSLFRLFYWNSYRASHHALHNAGPIHLVALDKIWGEREKSGIWLSVICPVAVCSKALVRRHHTRRVRAALAIVFNEQGLGRNGKVMDGQTSPLQGTIHVLLFSPILQAESSRIRQDCATMVYNIMKEKNRGQALSSPFDRQSTKGPNNSNRTLKQGERLNLGDKKAPQFGGTSNIEQKAKRGKESSFGNRITLSESGGSSKGFHSKRLNISQT